MKYRRKPVERDVVDAIKLSDCYVFVDASGVKCEIPLADFEADYEPITRKPRTKAAKPRTRKKKENGAGAGADAP